MVRNEPLRSQQAIGSNSVYKTDYILFTGLPNSHKAIVLLRQHSTLSLVVLIVNFNGERVLISNVTWVKKEWN